YGEVVFVNQDGNALSIDVISNLPADVVAGVEERISLLEAPASEESETVEDAPDEEPEGAAETADEEPEDESDEESSSRTTIEDGPTITNREDGLSSRITAPNGAIIASGELQEDGTIVYTDAAGNEIRDDEGGTVIDGELSSTQISNNELAARLGITPEELAEMDSAVSRGPNFATRQRMDALELWSGAANKYGGWVGLFMKPGEAAGLAGNIARWAGYDADSMSEGQAATLLWFQNAFGYDAWAGKMCRTQLISEEGTTFVSASGHTSIDISGEREIIDPCAGHGDWKLTHNNTAADCTKYYQYRITGEAVPAEVYMEFDVYLNDADTGIEYNIGKDDHLYWDEMEGEGLLVKLNRSGERWSLAGMNMVVYETEADFDKVCLRFTERSFENMQTVIQALRNKDNPFCNKIIDAEPRQDGKEKEAARRSVSIGGSTSTTVGGGIGGSSSARGIVSGGGE
ncbi:hypothetical protein HQ545_01630, partial [Candidatus Woesearchaeota archaeon]|nr:hypothetical protein [Candidatus Woesearchaeota archaeon]